jgi:hypothetical protein
VALHFPTDLLLRIDGLPAWAHWTAMVGGDTVLLVYGLALLGRLRLPPTYPQRGHPP